MTTVRIRYFKESLIQELCCTMRNHAVALHLTETKTTVTEDIKKATTISIIYRKYVGRMSESQRESQR